MEATTNVLTVILQVFTQVGSWIVTAIQQFIPMFYAEGALTFLGVLATAGLSISVCFLLIGIIQRFMHFAG